MQFAMTTGKPSGRHGSRSTPGAAYSRVSPAIHGNDLIVGDIASSGTLHDGARIIAINQQNGPLLWLTYGRQQDFEDSPPGWPQKPTYGWDAGNSGRPRSLTALIVSFYTSTFGG
jgi:hypothetical protein